MKQSRTVYTEGGAPVSMTSEFDLQAELTGHVDDEAVDVEFEVKKAEAGGWTGIITAERKKREEREKRAGANLSENGGHLEITTHVRLKLTGRLDRTVNATNAHLALASGEQAQVDYEYDRYKVDEGYCGPNAVPYKGPKVITRTSTTTASLDNETRIFVRSGAQAAASPSHSPK